MMGKSTHINSLTNTQAFIITVDEVKSNGILMDKTIEINMHLHNVHPIMYSWIQMQRKHSSLWTIVNTSTTRNVDIQLQNLNLLLTCRGDGGIVCTWELVL